MGPVAWTTYLAVDDAEATVQAITEHGGSVLAPAMAVGEMGSMAVAVDPAGALFGLWQSGTNTGFNLYNAGGADVWNQCMVSDVEAAKSFYRDVFGFTYTALEGPMTYYTFEVDGQMRGGLGAAAEDAPPRWDTYFGTDDVDALVGKVEQAGGSVKTPAYDTPFGKMADLTGPDGEAFSVSSVQAADA